MAVLMSMENPTTTLRFGRPENLGEVCADPACAGFGVRVRRLGIGRFGERPLRCPPVARRSHSSPLKKPRQLPGFSFYETVESKKGKDPTDGGGNDGDENADQPLPGSDFLFADGILNGTAGSLKVIQKRTNRQKVAFQSQSTVKTLLFGIHFVVTELLAKVEKGALLIQIVGKMCADDFSKATKCSIVTRNGIQQRECVSLIRVQISFLRMTQRAIDVFQIFGRAHIGGQVIGHISEFVDGRCWERVQTDGLGLFDKRPRPIQQLQRLLDGGGDG